jgi:hypothetical protein
MATLIHSNANKASNLLRLSALLTVISYFLFSDRKSLYVMAAVFITIFLLIGSAYLIRKGNNWVKWPLSVWAILAIGIDVIAIPNAFKLSIANGLFAILQDLIMCITIVLLFLPYKPAQDDSISSEISEPNSTPPAHLSN